MHDTPITHDCELRRSFLRTLATLAPHEAAHLLSIESDDELVLLCFRAFNLTGQRAPGKEPEPLPALRYVEAEIRRRCPSRLPSLEDAKLAYTLFSEGADKIGIEILHDVTSHRTTAVQDATAALRGQLDLCQRLAEGDGADGDCAELANDFGGTGWENEPAPRAVASLAQRHFKFVEFTRRDDAHLTSVTLTATDLDERRRALSVLIERAGARGVHAGKALDPTFYGKTRIADLERQLRTQTRRITILTEAVREYADHISGNCLESPGCLVAALRVVAQSEIDPDAEDDGDPSHT